MNPMCPRHGSPASGCRPILSLSFTYVYPSRLNLDQTVLTASVCFLVEPCVDGNQDVHLDLLSHVDAAPGDLPLGELYHPLRGKRGGPGADIRERLSMQSGGSRL